MKVSKNTIKKMLKKHIGRDQKVMLNLGCGTDYKQGWVNIDNNSDNNIKKLDINWDLREQLPFDKNSVDFIFNEHLIEHLDAEEGQAFIKNCLRVIKPRGVLRIATPDLETVVDKYLNLPLTEDPAIKRFNMDFIKTRAERMNMAFHWWGHKWLYDWQELERRLIEAGCAKDNIVRCKINESNSTELNGLETREESTLIAEITK